MAIHTLNGHRLLFFPVRCFAPPEPFDALELTPLGSSPPPDNN